MTFDFNGMTGLVTACGTIVGIFALTYQISESRRQRDLQALLAMSESFRSRWEGGWDEALTVLEKGGPEEKVHEAKRQLGYLLNWIDWFGWMLRLRLVNEPDIVLGSLAPAVRRVIALAIGDIAKDCEHYGKTYWMGVLEVANHLGIKMTF